MKARGKVILSRYVVNVTLISALILSTILVTAFSPLSTLTFPEQTIFQILLVNALFLLIGLGCINFYGGRYCLQVMADKQNEDKLSGCLTRQAFNPRYEMVLQESMASRAPITLMLIDVDHFRRINDTYGHIVGDELLSLLGETVRSFFRPSDLSCRWAGDQILVVLKNCSTSNASRLAEGLLTRVRQLKVVHGAESINFTTSIGIAQMRRGDTAESIISRAETGLYSACDEGRDTCAVGYDWIVIEYYCEPIF